MPADGARRAALSSLFAPAAEEQGAQPSSSRASRRDSVLALGSIEHLQRFYAAEGL